MPDHPPYHPPADKMRPMCPLSPWTHRNPPSFFLSVQTHSTMPALTTPPTRTPPETLSPFPVDKSVGKRKFAFAIRKIPHVLSKRAKNGIRHEVPRLKPVAIPDRYTLHFQITPKIHALPCMPYPGHAPAAQHLSRQKTPKQTAMPNRHLLPHSPIFRLAVCPFFRLSFLRYFVTMPDIVHMPPDMKKPPVRCRNGRFGETAVSAGVLRCDQNM